MTLPIEKILITRETIERKIREMGTEITRHYRGEELVLISVLKGSVPLLTDLMKELDLDVEIGFLFLSSYKGERSPQAEIQHVSLPLPPMAGRNVLLVDDILDSGASLAYGYSYCQSQNPRSLKTCVLLVKEGSVKEGVREPDFRGFDIPNVFVVGYGLDYQEKYRQLPYVAIPDIS